MPPLTLEELNEAAAEFVGDLMQMPPMVSAVKKDGVPLYKLARKGIEVEREPRLIHIYNFRFSATRSRSAISAWPAPRAPTSAAWRTNWAKTRLRRASATPPPDRLGKVPPDAAPLEQVRAVVRPNSGGCFRFQLVGVLNDVALDGDSQVASRARPPRP